jgi:hypothetical protein
LTGRSRAPETFRTGSIIFRGGVGSHNRAAIGLGATIKYPQRTTTQRPENFATRNERLRGKRTGRLDHVSATHNERWLLVNGLSRYQVSGMAHFPFTTSSLYLPCLVRASQVKLILSPKQRAKPAASRTRTCTNSAVCIACGECPSRF